MKKLIFCLAFLMVGAMSMNAQSCKKGAKSKCCAKKAAAKAEASTTKVAASLEEAITAAKADANIETKVCEKSGKTSFYQKSVCAKSGAVSMDEVQYCSKSKKFTKVAAASMERDAKTSCSKDKKACSKDKKACAKGEAKKECKKSCSKTCTKGKDKKAN